MQIEEKTLVDKAAKPKQILNLLKRDLGIETSYSAVHKAKEAILNGSADDHREQFLKIPDYLCRLQDPPLFTEIKTADSRFDSCFISSSAAKNAFFYCRKFVALDGTFTKNRFTQSPLLATTAGGNASLIILAWALVPTESEATWTLFLHSMHQAR